MAIKVKNKVAFSLAEALISMIIIMIVSMGSLPILTKLKTVTSTTAVTTRGQFACYYDASGTLKQWQFSERTPLTDDPESVSGQCILELNRRPAHFYIAAVGAGSDYNPGQLKTLYTTGLSETLYIRPGRYKDGVSDDSSQASILSSNTIADDDDDMDDNDYASTYEVFAKGGTGNVTNGLIGANLKSCKLKSLGSACGFSSDDESTTVYLTTPLTSTEKASKCYTQNDDTNCTQTGCDLVDAQIAGVSTTSIKINGCDYTDDSGNIRTDNIIPVDKLTFVSNFENNLNLNAISADNTTVTSGANSSYWSYSTPNTTYITGAQTYFEFEDSSYTPLVNLLGLQENIGHGRTDYSAMSTIIDEIPPRRVSELTELIKSLKPGAIGNNGAVLILW